MMITVPPMVGVPRLLPCPAGPSDLISWPYPRRVKILIATGVPNSATAIETAADSSRVLTDPPPKPARPPRFPGRPLGRPLPVRRLQASIRPLFSPVHLH